jgi:membrane protease YdiL (CAAX protease family)
MTRSDLFGRSGLRAFGAYIFIWGIAVAYLAVRGADWMFPLASLGIFGLVLGAIIWFLTRNMNAPAVPVAHPARESRGLLVYLLVYAVLLIGIWLGTIRHAIPPGETQELAIRPLFDSGIKRRGFWTTLIVLCALMFALLSVVSPSLNQIGALGLAPAAAVGWVLAAWAWNSIEAGLCEEFFFRACLQSRLTAWLKSPAAAIVTTSLLFALSHWPGLYLRGNPEVDGWSTDPIQVAAFTIATLSPLSIALGLLWARSRSLLLIVLVHGAIDALPNTAELMHIWG